MPRAYPLSRINPSLHHTQIGHHPSHALRARPDSLLKARALCLLHKPAFDVWKSHASLGNRILVDREQAKLCADSFPSSSGKSAGSTRTPRHHYFHCTSHLFVAKFASENAAIDGHCSGCTSWNANISARKSSVSPRSYNSRRIQDT